MERVRLLKRSVARQRKSAGPARARWPLGALPIAVLTLASCAAGFQSAPTESPERKDTTSAPATASAPATREVPKMSAAQVVARVKAKDWSLVDQAVAIPPQAAPDVAGLMTSPDNEVRELATHALNAAGGPQAVEALFKALNDPNDIVRANAARFLHQHATPADAPLLIRNLRTHEDEFVREQAALILGKFNDPAAAKPLNEQHAIETFADARHAMSLALVRLGDAKQAEALVARLKQDDPRGRVDALEDLLYVRDRKFVPDVLALLADKREGKNVGPSHGPYYIRVCDVVINVMDQVLNKPFPFQVQRVKRYSTEELAQANKVLAAVK